MDRKAAAKGATWIENMSDYAEHEDRVLNYWRCPKCGKVNWQDVVVVEQGDIFRYRHSCGRFLKVHYEVKPAPKEHESLKLSKILRQII